MDRGTPIANLQTQPTVDTTQKKDDIVQNIINDISNPQPPPVQFEDVQQKQQAPPPVPTHEHVTEVLENYEQQEEDANEPAFLTTLKDPILLFIIFVIFNYEPLCLVLANMVNRFNIPHLELIIRATLAAALFFIIKKFL